MLPITSAILINLGLPETKDCVPAPEIKEIGGLHIESYNDYDFCGLKTTTIYCGPAFKF